MFKRPDIERAIQDELYEAQRKLLSAETALEYATSEVAYQTSRIKRLERMINDLKNSQPS